MGRVWKLAGAILWLPVVLSAQSTFGTILGTVTDSTGAVVPQTRIIVTNQGENTTRTLTTDAQGNYEALNLKAGTYTVTAEASGFKTFKATELQLEARQTLRVNVSFALGQINETVQVTGAAGVVTTDTATIASSFGTQQVLDLPINYRGAGSTSPLRVLHTSPGIQSDNGYNFAVQGSAAGADGGFARRDIHR